MTPISSIDMGSLTARLLVAQPQGHPPILDPLTRERRYIRLAEGFNRGRERCIKEEAMERAVLALEEFRAMADGMHAPIAMAVATGVIRDAVNRDDFLALIYNRTGVRVTIISGEEEARLTAKGVLSTLAIGSGPFLIFDMGGGSTEFIYGCGGVRWMRSLPLGAVIFTERFFQGDPPQVAAMEALDYHVGAILKKTFSDEGYSWSQPHLIGTGGTVTTLTAMIHAIHVDDIRPERMNGWVLPRNSLEDLLRRIRVLPVEERGRLPGLDRERAGVIPAGTSMVMKIMDFFNVEQMTVSLSDILEGMLIDHLEGVGHGKS